LIEGFLFSWEIFIKLIIKSDLTDLFQTTLSTSLIEKIIALSISSIVALLVSILAAFDKTNNSEETVKLYIISIISPFVLFGLVIPRWIFLAIKKSPVWIPLVGKFFMELFQYIHSDVRLLCGMDAAIGAGVGYFAGDMLIGALFGGAFGLLNYKIVRTYIFKISPQEN
jgi:hypothetical protein